MQKVFSDIKPELKLDFIPFSSLPADVKTHLELMPATCFVHKSLLTFVSGFMNYKAEKLLNQGGGSFLRPSGDVVMTCFPLIYDNPDIVEQVSVLWEQDVQPRINDNKQINIAFLKEKTTDFVSRLYPVLFSEEFRGIEYFGSFRSAAADSKKLEMRKILIQSALRFKQSHPVKKQEKEAPSAMTTFKPFSVSELDFPVWESQTDRQDEFLRKLSLMGKGFDDNASLLSSDTKQVRFE